ncbi:MAG TPA: hypothetical protein VKU19_22005 [Bryobacteraceae bacterium]|nr:hypothetical protein [Bryobacteraceae bacterium]
MPFVFKRLVLFMSIAAAFAADKEAPFKAAPAASQPHHQTNDKVTIGVDAFSSGDKIKSAFGKLNPYQYGILPVLVVIQNDSDKTIRLDKIKAEYVGPGGDRIEATPASEVRYINGGKRPTTIPGPISVKKKNPLEAWEIEGRALAAQMLPAGNTASGFLYFQTGLHSTATIYLSGIKEAGTDRELLFFEIPLR